jgi:hypothetical protein
MAGTPWLDLPYMALTRGNVRAEAAGRDLSFRGLMALYYQHNVERAVHLSMHWRVVPDHPKQLFGKARVGQFVGDLREFLAGAGFDLTVTSGNDSLGLDELRALKEERRVRDLQERRPQQGLEPVNPRKRKRGGDRKAKDTRRRPRQKRTTPAEALPPPNTDVRYDDGDGNVFLFTAAGAKLVEAAKPPAKRPRKRARRSPSTSSSSSSASSSSSSSSSLSSSSSSSSSASSGVSTPSPSYVDWILVPPSSSSSPSGSSRSSEDDHPPRAEPSAPAKGGGAVPAAEAARPPPEIEVIYSKPPERVGDDRWMAAFRRAQPAEEEEEA